MLWALQMGHLYHPGTLLAVFCPVVHASPGWSTAEGTEAPTTNWWVPEDGPKSICPMSGRSDIVQAAVTPSWRQQIPWVFVIVGSSS